MPRVTMPVIADVRPGGTRYYVDNLELAFSAAAPPVPTAEGSLIISDAGLEYDELLHPGAAGYALVTDATTADWDQTPAWTGEHSFADGIAFTGASDANEITVPDNTAIAFELEDAGGLEYLRLVTTDAQPVVVWNEAGVDVDYRVEAVGVADALVVQGSDGQITLGALGAGFVQSTAGGVLSSAAIAVGDLPAHAAEHEVGGGDLVNHDSLTGFVANEHIDHTAVTLTAGNGLTGGGDISANRTFTLGTPSTVGAFTSNTVTATSHYHQVENTTDATASPSRLMAANASGQMTLEDLFVPDGGVVGISAAAERVEFYTAGYVAVMGANLGVGIASPTDLIYAFRSTNGTAYMRAENTDAAGTSSLAGMRAVASTADMIAVSHGAGRVATRYGITLADYSEIATVAGEGLLIGTGALAKPIVFGTNNTERARILSSGEVGIGTATPDQLLEIEGSNARIHLDGTNAQLLVDRNAVTNRAEVIYQSAGVSAWYLGLADSDDLGDGSEFFLGTTSGGTSPAIVVETSGNVGIGATAPDYTLDVAGNVGIDEYIYHNGDADTYTRFETDRWRLFAGAVQMIDAYETTNDYLNLHAGQVGINETANTFGTINLAINQGTNTDEILTFKSSNLAHGITTNTGADTFGMFKSSSSSNGGVRMWGFGKTYNALRLDGAGTNDDITKSIAALGYIQLHAYKKSGTTIGDAGADANLVVIANNGTSRFIFDAEGTGHADVSWVTFSDRRLKSNIVPISYGLNEVMQLEPVNYIRQGSGRAMIGLIAQDVYGIVPEATRKPPNEHSYWSLDYNALVPVLVKAIQELKAEVEELKNEISV